MVTIAAPLIIALLMPTPAAGVPRPFGEAAIGTSRVRPFVTGSAATLAFGAGMRGDDARAPVTPWGELGVLSGFDVPNGNPEAANSGRQTIVSLLAGGEAAPPRVRDLVLIAGAGVGHSAVRGARGPLRGPDQGAVHQPDRTAPAYVLGLGWSFRDAENTPRSGMALRVDSLISTPLESSAYATTLSAFVSF